MSRPTRTYKGPRLNHVAAISYTVYMIVGFSGKLKTGKTTAALYLLDHGFERRSFAGVLRSIVGKTFGATEKQLADGDFKESVSPVGGLTWRKLLIDTGAFLRSLDPDFFLNRLDFSGKLVAVDDVRFKNEAQRIKDKGGFIIRVSRPGVKTLDDISENDLDGWPWDFKVVNDGDYAHLFNQIDSVLTQIGLLNEPGKRDGGRVESVEEGVGEAH